ncbi:hypothetical protein GIB67_028441 [Kingdonia uniflora]|uniref:Uncharacterized protein n=1 Tax=Kingdonia uniflora TaxID=39325 RepID=A0A7J7P1F4_9MAGN|nr:hypothetical protein GIB67_028441 [Kingdonia uniflora]
MSTMMEELSSSMVNSSSNGGEGTPEKEQQAAGVGTLLQIMMLILSFVLGHLLRRHKVYYLPEASASLVIGSFFDFGSICESRYLESLQTCIVATLNIELGG